VVLCREKFICRNGNGAGDEAFLYRSTIPQINNDMGNVLFYEIL
jgi:hypothetical protein